MNFLEEKIVKDGIVKEGNVLKVDSFLNHQMDIELFNEMGREWKRLEKWQIYVLTSHENFQYIYGRRADKVRKLYNGMIPCNLYQFFKNK